MDSLSLAELYTKPHFVGYLLLQFVAWGALTQVFSRTKWFDQNPSGGAHQFVGCGSFTFLGVYGTYLWFFDVVFAEAFEGGSGARLFGYYEEAATLVHIMIGYMIFDSVALAVARAGPEFFAHHVLTFTLANISMLYGGTYFALYYAVFFFGLIEVSSIPLAAVDLFRANKGLSQAIPNGPVTARATFAAMFVVVRGCYWPFVMFGFIRDLLAEDVKLFAFVLYGFTAAALTLLQYFWLYLIIRGVMKQFSGGQAEVDKMLDEGDRKGTLTSLTG